MTLYTDMRMNRGGAGYVVRLRPFIGGTVWWTDRDRQSQRH